MAKAKEQSNGARHLSDEGRERIAKAQRKRWKAYRAQKKAAAK